MGGIKYNNTSPKKTIKNLVSKEAFKKSIEIKKSTKTTKQLLIAKIEQSEKYR